MGRVGISGTTWATEMVHLSKFEEFHENLNGNTINIDTQFNLNAFLKRCIVPIGPYDMWRSRFSAPKTFGQLEP